jgi:hypothetical protein
MKYKVYIFDDLPAEQARLKKTMELIKTELVVSTIENPMKIALEKIYPDCEEDAKSIETIDIEVVPPTKSRLYSEEDITKFIENLTLEKKKSEKNKENVRYVAIVDIFLREGEGAQISKKLAVAIDEVIGNDFSNVIPVSIIAEPLDPRRDDDEIMKLIRNRALIKRNFSPEPYLKTPSTENAYGIIELARLMMNAQQV